MEASGRRRAARRDRYPINDKLPVWQVFLRLTSPPRTIVYDFNLVGVFRVEVAKIALPAAMIKLKQAFCRCDAGFRNLK